MILRLFVIFSIGCCASSAFADEQMRPLAVSGDWMAMQHSVSMTAGPDVCIVANLSAGLAFRADEDTKEIRVINSSWSLPASVDGDIQVTVGALTKRYSVSANTATSVMSSMTDDDIAELFGAMDKATSMAVTVGRAKPIVVSLAGSTKTTNAFRTCAGIHGNAPSPGANPFSPS